MGKYRALTDMPPIKKGEVVEFKEPLVDGLKAHYEPVGDKEETSEVDETDREQIEGQLDLEGNISRDELKKEAVRLGVDFAPNAPTAKLLELVKEAQEAEDAGNEG